MTVGNLFSSFEAFVRSPMQNSATGVDRLSRRTMSDLRPARNATRKFMHAGRKRPWRTLCAIQRRIRMPSSPTCNQYRSQVRKISGGVCLRQFLEAALFHQIGDDYFPLPVQWDIGNRAWRPYMVPATGGDWWGALYPPDNMQRPTGPTCDGCHSVDYNIQTKQVAEWNVGCERCHGPGSEHVAHPSRDNILNPAQMDSVAASDTCIQCHSQGQPGAIRSKENITTGRSATASAYKLQDFWKLEDCTLGQTTFYYFPDCTAHKNRMQGNDFAQSVMYRHGITCSSCHDVHGTDNYAQLRKPANQICLDCHGPSSPNGPRTATLEEHTHHKNGSPGSQCVACHMPAIETEGVPGTFVHAHTFRFISPDDDRQVWNPQLLHLLSQREIDRLGNRCDAAMARGLAWRAMR